MRSCHHGITKINYLRKLCVDHTEEKSNQCRGSCTHCGWESQDNLRMEAVTRGTNQVLRELKLLAAPPSTSSSRGKG